MHSLHVRCPKLPSIWTGPYLLVQTQNFEKSLGNTLHPTLLPMTPLLVCVNVWMVITLDQRPVVCITAHFTVKTQPKFHESANNSKTRWIIYIFVIQGAYTHTKTHMLLFQLAGMVYLADRENTYEFGKCIRLDTPTPFMWDSHFAWCQTQQHIYGVLSLAEKLDFLFLGKSLNYNLNTTFFFVVRHEGRHYKFQENTENRWIFCQPLWIALKSRISIHSKKYNI